VKKNTIIELATYLMVGSAIWIIAPLLGKVLDTFTFQYPSLLSESLPMLSVGLMLIILGTLLVGWTIFLFKTQGHGTPNPKLPPNFFIVSGPYKYSRNPMALGGLVVLTGEALLYHSPSLFAISVLFGIIIYFNAQYVEEPELKHRFGEKYEQYLRTVPRLFPRLRQGTQSSGSRK